MRRPLRCLQKNLFVPERPEPSMPTEQRMKLVKLIEVMLDEAVIATVAAIESETATEVGNDQDHA